MEENWDGLGMRASGSNDVVLDGCRVPDAMVLPLGTWGEADALTLVNLVAIGLGLVGAFLGIAETAQATLIGGGRSAPRNRSVTLDDRHCIRHLVAENEIALAASRSMLERTARCVDTCLGDSSTSPPAYSDLQELMKKFQCTKSYVNRAAIEVIDRAPTIRCCVATWQLT